MHEESRAYRYQRVLTVYDRGCEVMHEKSRAYLYYIVEGFIRECMYYYQCINMINTNLH